MLATKIARRLPRTLAAVVLLGFAGTAGAFHRETPPVTVITTSGDTDLPRLPSQGRRLMALVDGQQEVVTLVPFSTQDLTTPLGAGGNPAVSFSGRTVAWETAADPLGSGLPGSQIVLARNGKLSAGVDDPSGTSANPSLDKRGETLAFESAGDLTGLGSPDVNRVYVRFKDGALALASSGTGASGHAMLAAKGGILAFESTSDPTTGLDTGIEQVWVGSVTSLPAARITNGASPSTNPIVSDDGRLVAFVSEAALASDGADTGVPQIFAYDTRSQTFAQITAEAGGCGRPGIAKIQQDWRITFICGGEAYYHMLRQNARYHVPTPDGSTQSIIPEMGSHFLLVSTTADLLAGSGTTSGHQIYLLNLFKAPAPAAGGTVAWFPFQGIPGL